MIGGEIPAKSRFFVGRNVCERYSLKLMVDTVKHSGGLGILVCAAFAAGDSV